MIKYKPLKPCSTSRSGIADQRKLLLQKPNNHNYLLINYIPWHRTHGTVGHGFTPFSTYDGARGPEVHSTKNCSLINLSVLSLVIVFYIHHSNHCNHCYVLLFMSTFKRSKSTPASLDGRARAIEQFCDLVPHAMANLIHNFKLLTVMITDNN